MNQIKGKVVVITGASSGLGEAAARRLCAEGATVVLAARRQRLIEELADQLRQAGGSALAIQTDVTQREQVQRLIDTAVSQFDRIDALVNNAGLMPHSPLERLKVNDWERMIDVHLKGLMYGIAAALPHMKRQKSGHMIMVSSVAGHKVRPTSAVYAATKTAVRVIAEGFRQEVKPYNIRTTVISPGSVVTNLADSITEPDIEQAVRDFTARYGVPADSFARMVSFALSQPDEIDVNEILYRPTLQEL
jgi:NADP-dependent 3-hydroxy acid dehydrogenase YdfG